MGEGAFDGPSLGAEAGAVRGAASWRAHVGGRLVEIPATIDAVREALTASDPERLAEFEA
ncbi:hypothetical protein [Streptomyces jumonjinensis]|uniref:hypothetical protein n=1 Tax=Streptomyces jumonjinensis TaxID=1945 RepID=UPI0037ABC440